MSKRKNPGDSEASSTAGAASELGATARRHLRFGWLSLSVFLLLGLGLEVLHGFKVGWYVDVTYAMRREMWRLAHAHGTLLSLVNVAFAVSIPLLNQTEQRWRTVASPCLFAATLTLPAGFFLGGVWFYPSDPGLGILLVPVGAVLLILAVCVTAFGVDRSPPE